MDLRDKLINVVRGCLTDKGLKLLLDLYDGKVYALSKRDSFFNADMSSVVQWMEERLAQFGYLSKDQVNNLWSDSTDKALIRLHYRYTGRDLLVLGSYINKPLLEFLVDGQKAYIEQESRFESFYDFLENMVTSRGYEWYNSNNKVNMVGLRGYLIPEGKIANIEDVYNDTIFQAYKDKYGNKFVKGFTASCDPGSYYYKHKVLNRKGCAHLKDGQWMWQRGRHGISQYRAFVQAAPVTVVRSFRGVIKEGDFEETGYFGINGHAGTFSKRVWNASAGCQVVFGHRWSNTFKTFRENAYQASQTYFPYTLLSDFIVPSKEKPIFQNYVKQLKHIKG